MFDNEQPACKVLSGNDKDGDMIDYSKDVLCNVWVGGQIVAYNMTLRQMLLLVKANIKDRYDDPSFRITVTPSTSTGGV